MEENYTSFRNVLDDETLELKAKLLGSLLLFTQIMFQTRTGRVFQISEPDGAESHFKTICREFTKAFYGETTRLLINCPPGWSKSELCKHFIAWSLAHYPDCNFLYVSHSIELAAKHTHGIKQIIELPLYKKLFGVTIRADSAAKDHFTTMAGGVVSGWGAKGGITGYDAGLPGLDRFSGALVIDDIHKPDEVHSDTIRAHVKRNFTETLERRLRSPRVPIFAIGQRLHEDDLFNVFKSGADGQNWKTVIIKALDDAGNAIYPELNPKDMLLNLQDKSPYVFSSQFQQDPLPAGGGIFKTSWFQLLDEDPNNIVATFITADTAETSKSYNDATVFSFFGLYKIHDDDIDTGIYGLHWIDCRELRIEPKDLESEFKQFYADCMRYPVKPRFAGIEKKSTGVTLISILKEMRGLNIIDIDRTRASGNKTTRYLEIQPIVADRRVSITRERKHSNLCIDHMRKITANDTHSHDDICDTLYDGVKLGLIDQIISDRLPSSSADEIKTAEIVMQQFSHLQQVRQKQQFGGLILPAGLVGWGLNKY